MKKPLKVEEGGGNTSFPGGGRGLAREY